MVGYHEKYMSDVAVQMHERNTVKWFTLDDARGVVEALNNEFVLPDDQGQALRIFRSVQDSILGLSSLGVYNIAIGTPGHDVVINFNGFNPFRLLAYILDPIDTSGYSDEIPEGGVVVQSPKGKAKAKPKNKASGEAPSESKSSETSSPEKPKAKAKGGMGKTRSTLNKKA